MNMLRIWKRFKKKINDSFEKMAQENKKEYGGRRLDCCNLNRNDNTRKQVRR